MEKIFTSALVMVAFAVSASGAETKISRETALDAIMTFRADPFSGWNRGAAGIIFKFVEKSPDVVVNITRKALPFLGDKSVNHSDECLLLAAFVAGNVDSQLLKKRKKDDSYAGDLQVIATYRQMQQKNPKLRIASVEKLIDLEKRGELKRYVISP